MLIGCSFQILIFTKKKRIELSGSLNFPNVQSAKYECNRDPWLIFCRECGWRKTSASSTCQDPCVICLEVECTVAAEGTENLDS